MRPCRSLHRPNVPMPHPVADGPIEPFPAVPDGGAAASVRPGRDRAGGSRAARRAPAWVSWSAVAVARMSAGTSPRDTQLRWSAHTSIGGRNTRALSRATATFMATMIPKSRSSGSDEVAITPTPAMAVMADTMKARPVRAGGDVDRRLRARAPPPLLDEPQEDQRGELGAHRHHERTADGGHRAELEVERVGHERRGAHRDQHRHHRQQRPHDAAQPHREEEEHEQDRQVGEQDPVRLEVVEQADADHRQARRRGRRRPRGGSTVSRISRTTTARSSRSPAPVRKMRLSAPRRLVGGGLLDVGRARRRRPPRPRRRWAGRRRRRGSPSGSSRW